MWYLYGFALLAGVKAQWRSEWSTAGAARV